MALKHTLLSKAALTAGLSLSLLAACGGGGSSSGSEAFKLNFKAMQGATQVDCNNLLTGLGPKKTDSVGVNDLRFFISNLKFYDNANNELKVTLDKNDFQYNDPAGDVVLIDLTSNTSGHCKTDAIAFGSGTARTNSSIVGTVSDASAINRVSFDVGVPQKLMKKIIATNTAEKAPSPLGELYWSWASGYRHFLANFSVLNGAGNTGEGYLHIGSRGCGGKGLLALQNKEKCDFVNTPKANLDNFNPNDKTVIVALGKLFAGLDFIAPVRDSKPPYKVIGEGPGVSCHSAPPSKQADCKEVFANFGLDTKTGKATASKNTVFYAE